ncbi:MULTISPECIES: hypothetical protein [Stenotrophomonas]|uniref:hypothetical protein n=1 Tax=Stenotrophomonas TaxID=40323 RepID=UPI0006AC2A05|nr:MULTISPECIES: hypothetical protein [Stenotrophomonas]KOQ66942.1 hypothetical protein ABW42_04040 [Stenotrophomonas maltophilia]MCF3528922.1 hypothetical protein [Stenotrophomonas maltophilia]MCF3532806.1 hypothetical protein [Stenotrophomonas maltophilia]OFU93378.1 hypothetical protein HMPREF3114_12350 [Stenotrophomonas sp. HMSC10F07]
MELYWRLFTNCTSQQAALKVAARIFEQAGLEVSNLHAEPYHKGGFMVSACSHHAAQSWPEFVVLALASAQCTGRGWLLSGSIAEELDAWSNHSLVSGVSSIHIQAERRE